MQITKTLWVLDYQQGTWGYLIPIYAEDEHEAWVEAYHWAMQHDVTLPEDAVLVHFPNGFTIHMSRLTGQAEVNRGENQAQM